MSRFQQFGQRRAPLIGAPRAVPNLGQANNFAAIGAAVGDAFSTATVAAQAVTRETVRDRQETGREQQLKLAEDMAVREEIRREATRARLLTKELAIEYDELADQELFGVTELFTKGDAQTKADFIKNHQWASPKNQKRFESLQGHQLATVDWFTAQQEITQFYANPSNDGDSLRVTDVMGRFIEKRDAELTPGAALAYQRQFMGQVGNFIFQQEVGRANARKKEVEENRTRRDMAWAGMYLSGNMSLTGFAQVVSDGVALVEGDDDPDVFEKVFTTRMAQAIGMGLSKQIGVVPTTELRAQIAQLPDAVRNSPTVTLMAQEMVFSDKRAAADAISKEITALTKQGTRFMEGNQYEEIKMLRAGWDSLPQDNPGVKNGRTLLESRIKQMNETRNFAVNIKNKGANVEINEISGIQDDLSWEQSNFQRVFSTLREIADKDFNAAINMVTAIPNGDIGEIAIRAKPQEIQDWIGLLSRPAARAAFASAVELADKLESKSAVFKDLTDAAAPSDPSIARYKDRVIRHFLDLTTREINPVSEKQAEKMAFTMVKKELKQDFVRIAAPGAITTLAPAVLFRVGNLESSDDVGRTALGDALSMLAQESKRQGGNISPAISLSFSEGGFTYVPAAGDGQVGAFMQWDPRDRSSKIITAGSDPTRFTQLQAVMSDKVEDDLLMNNSEMRWRPSYGTRFVSEFDFAYFSKDMSQGILSWITVEAEQQWFAQNGQLPRTDIEGLTGRALEEVLSERRLFAATMNLMALDLGWSGLEPPDPFATSAPQQVPRGAGDEESPAGFEARQRGQASFLESQALQVFK